MKMKDQLNSQAGFWNTFQNLIQSTNNCAAGCSCINDRYEITHSRVLSWGKAAGPKSRDVLVSGLGQMRRSGFKEVDLEDLEEITNLPFKNEKDAEVWLGVWQHLLTSEAPAHEMDRRKAWLDANMEEFASTLPVRKEELVEVTLSLNGQLDWLNFDHHWESLAQTPLRSKIPNQIYYRFTAEPGIFEAELEERPFEDLASGLIDLRLIECNSLTDDCMESLSQIQNLRVLSLGSLQIQGKTLHLLSGLKNLKKLDLMGCKNIDRMAIERLQAQRKDLKILSPESQV